MKDNNHNNNLVNLYSLIMLLFKSLHIVEKVLKKHDYDLLNRDMSMPGVKCKFTDLQVIALAIVMCIECPNSENRLFSILANNNVSKAEIPNLIKRRQFNHRLKRLANILVIVQGMMADYISLFIKTKISVVDSSPLPVAKYYRAHKTEKWIQFDTGVQPTFAYCASKKEKYFGYKLHIVTNKYGLVECFQISGGHVHDKNFLESLPPLSESKILLADMGYICSDLDKEDLRKQGYELKCPSRKNQAVVVKLTREESAIRQVVENTFKAIKKNYDLEDIRAKSTQGFLTKYSSCVLTHTFTQFFADLENQKTLNAVVEIIDELRNCSETTYQKLTARVEKNFCLKIN